MRSIRHWHAPDMQTETYRRRDIAILYVFALTLLNLEVPKNVLRSSRAGTYSPSDHSDQLGDLIEANSKVMFDELFGYDHDDAGDDPEVRESRIMRAKLLVWWEENRSTHAKRKYERAAKAARNGE